MKLSLSLNLRLKPLFMKSKLAECGPGTYKQLAQPGGVDEISVFCFHNYGIDRCVECPAGTVKNVVGDSIDLCRVPCDLGMNNLPSDLSVCGKSILCKKLLLHTVYRPSPGLFLQIVLIKTDLCWSDNCARHKTQYL